MRCIVTAGPTIEPLDQVRRLTNFSTGRLGSELANHLQAAGFEVTLLLGEQATWSGPIHARETERFTTNHDLADRLRQHATSETVAVFHASAVSDFAFGRIWETDAAGHQTEITGGKISTRTGKLLAELVPTPKLISRLREWFPNGLLIGWKYEVDGKREDVLEKARAQIRENNTTLCVANGPAWGDGFGIVNQRPDAIECENREELFAALLDLARAALNAPPAQS